MSDEPNPAAVCSKLVRNWRALDPKIFEGVNCDELVKHLTNRWIQGGLDAMIAETGMERQEFENLIFM